MIGKQQPGYKDVRPIIGGVVHGFGKIGNCSEGGSPKMAQNTESKVLAFCNIERKGPKEIGEVQSRGRKETLFKFFKGVLDKEKRLTRASEES